MPQWFTLDRRRLLAPVLDQGQSSQTEEARVLEALLRGWPLEFDSGRFVIRGDQLGRFGVNLDLGDSGGRPIPSRRDQEDFGPP